MTVFMAQTTFLIRAWVTNSYTIYIHIQHSSSISIVAQISYLILKVLSKSHSITSFTEECKDSWLITIKLLCQLLLPYRYNDCLKLWTNENMLRGRLLSVLVVKTSTDSIGNTSSSRENTCRGRTYTMIHKLRAWKVGISRPFWNRWASHTMFIWKNTLDLSAGVQSDQSLILFS